jgi:hypothetical protein
MAQYLLPFTFKVVAKLPQKQGQTSSAVHKKRKRAQLEPTRAPVDHEPRAVRPRIDEIDVPSPRDSLIHDRIDDLLPVRREIAEGSQSNQAIISSNGDGNNAPMLMEVNPESGSITGGTRVWLKVIGCPSISPLFARFGTAVAPTVSPLACLSRPI